MKNIKHRWNVKSNFQVFVIILVFACTGSATAWLTKPILAYFGISKITLNLVEYYGLYLLVLFPIYQILLLSIGFVMGQFSFFWAFEKKLLKTLKFNVIFNLFRNK
ncbi:DUF6787 family protein [Flavobacterium aciduliphilum]|uniref:DUF6787 family protein n=1 Tax=Flavobacterium aciduliphilum TaxID=1101402 RepID=UPI000DD35B53|nr:DUF6787 family protein [Flavobacterium aciduliphilum]